LGHLLARTDLCFWKKILWAVAVIILPMGAFAYMALQSRAITDRKAARLSQSDCDAESGASSISDEIAEVDRLVPMIRHAIEIKGILEADDPVRTVPEPDRIGVCNETISNKDVYAGEPDRNCSGRGDSQRFPAVAA